MREILLFGILVSTYFMVIAKRIPALIRSFSCQSFLISLITAFAGMEERSRDLYIVAFFILVLKVFVIPIFLERVARRINVDEGLGLFVNPQLSLIFALVFTCLSWLFAGSLGFGQDYKQIGITVSFVVVLIGAFLMVFRMKAFTQVIGLLAMENGVFLFAAFVSGGMPFFVEIAVLLDVFVSAMIMGLFVYRINKLFTHIDTDKLTRLKG